MHEKTGLGKSFTMDGNENDDIKGTMHQTDACHSQIHLIKNQENHYQKQQQSMKEEVFPLLNNDKEELNNITLNNKQIQSK